MNPNDDVTFRASTPEEIKAYIEKRKREMTAAELMQDIDDDEPRIPAEQVINEIDAMLAKMRAERGAA